MEKRFLSFLYPTRDAADAALQGDSARMGEEVCRELGLSAVLDLPDRAINSFFTTDLAVIAYRQAVFADLARLPAVWETLNAVLPLLGDITELRRLDADYHPTGDSYLYSIAEVELYVSCIDRLEEGLAPMREQMQSEGLIAFTDTVLELARSEYYRTLNEDLKALSSRIHEVRSITVGVNLDAAMRPTDAGVIAVNATPFKSGRMLDKILRMSFKNDAMTCIAALTPFSKGDNENRQDALISAFNGALEDIFRSSVRSWRGIVGEYVLENTDFLLRILPEIELVTKSCAFLQRLRERGYPLCSPTVCNTEEKVFAARGLYNPAVALRIEERVVENDLAFDDNGRFYILTGPNRGGKSVITCALGIAQMMFQLGLPIPAEEASISPVDAIFIHFPTGAEDTLDKGRLGEECARLREIFDRSSGDSLILLDESLSSTGSFEASYIAAEILAAFAARRCRGLFSTHLHELASEVPEINRRSQERGGILVDTLVAGMEEGRRSFRIVRQKPDGKSYARDIAERYGLSFEKLNG